MYKIKHILCVQIKFSESYGITDSLDIGLHVIYGKHILNI